MHHPLPNPNTYWVEPGRLMAGEYPRDLAEEKSRDKLRQYLDCGVTMFLDLTEPGESGLRPYDTLLSQLIDGDESVQYVRLPIRDYDVPTTAHMRTILDRIDRALSDRHTVYVHCWGGVGRTGTVVGCFLIERGLSPLEALDRLAELWATVEKHYRKPQSPENGKQVAFVRAWG